MDPLILSVPQRHARESDMQGGLPSRDSGMSEQANPEQRGRGLSRLAHRSLGHAVFQQTRIFYEREPSFDR
jgi:hypothetical protein